MADTSSSRSLRQRAEAFVLPVPGCPSISDFEQLLDLQSEEVALDKQILLLESLTAWSRSLFIERDRALSSCTLYHAVQAKLAVLQQRAADTSDQPAIERLALLSDKLEVYPFPLIGRVKDEFGELQRSCGADKIDESRWTVLDNGASGDRIATFYRQEPDAGSYSFLVSGLVAAPLLNLAAMLKEAQLLSRWIPAVSESTLLSPLDASRYRMLLRVTLQLPWPLSNREAMLMGYGDMVGDSVGVFFRSTGPDSETGDSVFPGAGPDGADVRVPPVQRGSVRVKVKTGGFWLTPKSGAAAAAPVTRVRAIFNIDPQFSAVPFWFLNVMSKRFCAAIVLLMRQKAPALFASPGSAYSQALIQQARTYDEMRRRLKEVEAAAERAKHADKGAAGNGADVTDALIG